MSKSRLKNALLWILSIGLTLTIVIYQRATGPTYPVKGEVVIGSETIDYKLLRSHDTEINAPVEVEVQDMEVTGKLTFKRFKSYDEWTTVEMRRENGKLVSELPFQPAAGKIEYHVSLYKDGKEYELNEEPAIIRFKGAVPRPILIPHIFFMFISMLFGMRAALEAIFKGNDNRFYRGCNTVHFIPGWIDPGAYRSKIRFRCFLDRLAFWPRPDR